jgi:hypothetical protein
MMTETIAPPPLEVLDTTDPEAVTAFEEGFYLGFEKSSHNQLIQWLWIWEVESRRLRTRVPYEDQLIWVRRQHGRVEAAIAVNVRMLLLQSSAFGFSHPPDFSQDRQVCEILAAFTNANQSIANGHALWTKSFSDLRARGFTDSLATCALKLLPLYRRMGAKILAEGTIENEVRYFLHFHLVRTAGWLQRMDENTPEPAPLARTPAEVAAQVHQELGTALARLLPVIDLARGQPDPGFGLEARRRGALHVLAGLTERLSGIDAAPGTAATIHRGRHQAAVLTNLWQHTAECVRQTVLRPESIRESSTSSIMEALDTLILSALEAWDGDEDALETLVTLTRDDRSPVVARLVSHAVSRGQPTASLAAMGTAFASAVQALHQLALSLRPE